MALARPSLPGGVTSFQRLRFSKIRFRRVLREGDTYASFRRLSA
jgi:hypothetical protein